MRSLVAAAVITMVCFFCWQPAQAGDPAPSASEQQNLALVLYFWNNVYIPRKMQRLPAYFSADYLDHNPNINGRGIPALLNYMEALRKRAKSQPQQSSARLPRSDVIASFVHGDLVTLIRKRMLPDPERPSKLYQAFGFEMFRVQDGKIVEHWDSITKGLATP